MEHLVEGYARVAEVEDGIAWLVPEPAAACGSCAAKAGCGTAYLRPKALHDRRFAVPDDFHARVGERVVVGLTASAINRASAVAYIIPIVSLLAAAMAASLMGASDAGAAAAAIMGLVAGIALARLAANRLAASGEVTPVVLRRAAPESCATQK